MNIITFLIFLHVFNSSKSIFQKFSSKIVYQIPCIKLSSIQCLASKLCGLQNSINCGPPWHSDINIQRLIFLWAMHRLASSLLLLMVAHMAGVSLVRSTMSVRAPSLSRNLTIEDEPARQAWQTALRLKPS